MTAARRSTPRSGPPNAVPRPMTTAASTTTMIIAITASWSRKWPCAKPLFVWVVAPVVGDERAEEADEPDPGPDLVDEALVVGPGHVEEEAADPDPHRSEDGRQEGEDHGPVVPGPAVPLPVDVGDDGKQHDECSREGARPDLAGADRHPESEDDGPRGQVLRHWATSCARSGGRLREELTALSPRTRWRTCRS